MIETRKSLRFITFFALYAIMFIIFYSLVVSGVLFFQFELGHSFNIINYWIQDHLWELILISKVPVFYVFYKFLLAKNNYNYDIKKEIKNEFSSLKPQIFVYIFFLFFFFTVIGKPVLNSFDSNNILKVIVGIFSNLFYWGSDIFLLSHYFTRFNVEDNSERFLFLLVYLAISMFTLFYFLPYSKNINVFFIVNYLSSLLLFMQKSKKWIFSILNIFFLVSFFGMISGNDILWGKRYSVFLFSAESINIVSVLIWLVAIGYLLINRENKNNISEFL